MDARPFIVGPTDDQKRSEVIASAMRSIILDPKNDSD